MPGFEFGFFGALPRKIIKLSTPAFVLDFIVATLFLFFLIANRLLLQKSNLFRVILPSSQSSIIHLAIDFKNKIPNYTVSKNFVSTLK